MESSDDANAKMATVSDLSDQDILISYCLENKISKIAIDELLKRGYDSLAALRLVNIEDLSSQNIPMGQRRLIVHIAHALGADDSTSGATGNSVATTSASTGNTRVFLTTSITHQQVASAQLPAAGHQQQHPQVSDAYSQTLLNTLLNQEAQVSSMTGPSSTSAINNDNVQLTGTGSQALPSLSDPQIHISSATGRSASTFFYICDFVPQAVDEDLVVGGQRDQQLVIKSGPKKPKLECLTLSQWSVANLAIFYRLVNEGKLVGPNLTDYLSYTTKVYQLVKRFNLPSVLLYDREYRKLQASMSFCWGTDVQHLHTLFLQPRAGPGSKANASTSQRKGNVGNQFPPRSKGETHVDVC